MNVECRRKEFYRFLLIQKTERNDSILHDSTRLSSSQAAVRYSIFCGSLFNPGSAIEAASLIIKKTVPFWRSFIQGFRVQRLTDLYSHKKRAESILDSALHGFSWNALIVEFQGYVHFG
jgi:hypothetical protein